MSEHTDTPAETLRAATDENVLKQAKLTLLGTVIKTSSKHALIRYRGGRIKSISLGDRLGRGTVVAIDDGSLMLAQSGKTHKMTVPGN